MNTLIAKEGRLIDGIVRTPGVTYQDIRAEDPNPGPDEVYGDFPQPSDDFTIPNSWYFSPEHAALEKEKLWSQVWVWACRVEKIPTVGSCYVHDFLDDSILIVRVAKNEFKAYRNTCRHRGNQLRAPGSCGVIKKFFCPYHGATWNLDGTIDSWPFEYEFPSVNNDNYGLHEVHLANFQGFLFVSTAENPVPFDEYIDPLPKMLNGVSWENRYPVLHMRKHLRCNWKIVNQAFHETMHVPVTHPEGRPVNLVAGSQSDILGKYIARIMNVNFVSGDTFTRELSELELIERILNIDESDSENFRKTLPEGVRARDFAADMFAQGILADTGVDVSTRPTTELVDNLVYHIFPNFMLLHAFHAPVAHLFSPGANPDEMFFDIMWFKECEPGTEKPPAPERIDVGVDETFADHHEGLGTYQTLIPDQDTANMEGQQRGLKASPHSHSLFANYLESGIVHELKIQKELFGLD